MTRANRLRSAEWRQGVLEDEFAAVTEPSTTTTPAATATRLWWVLAAIAAVAAVAAHVTIAWGPRGPAMPFDEVTFLQMARWLAGEETPDRLLGAGYFPGWSFLLAPVWWVTSDPWLAYQLAKGIGIATALATAVPLTLWVRRVGVTTPQATFIALVTVTLPAVTVQSDFVLAESLLVLLVAVLALSVWRLWERPSFPRAAVVGLIAGLTYFVHLRALVVVIVTAIWLLLFAWRSWRHALAGLALLAGTWWAARVMGARIAEAVLGGELKQEDSLTEGFEALTVGWVGRITAGHSWTQLVGTLGLAALAVVVTLVLVARALRHLRPSPIIWFFGLALAVLAVSVIKWSNPLYLVDPVWSRFDYWFYGRYIDPAGVLAFALALALAIRGVRRWVTIVSAALGALVSCAALVLLVPFATTWGYVSPPHVAGLLAFQPLLPTEPPPPGTAPSITDPTYTTFFLVASASALVLPLVIALARRHAAVIGVVALVGATWLSFASDTATDGFHHLEGTVPDPVLSLSEHGEDLSVEYVIACGRDRHLNAVGENYFGWWFSGVDLEVVRELDPETTADVVVWCADAGDLPIPGAVNVTPEASYWASTIWLLDPDLVDAES